MDEVRLHLDKLRFLLANEVPQDYRDIRTYDARDSDASMIVDWLQLQGMPDEPVNVFWLNDQEGIVIGLNDFIKNFDDLWYPSSDDLVVESQSNKFVLYIDHEEQLRLFLKKEKNGDALR